MLPRRSASRTGLVAARGYEYAPSTKATAGARCDERAHSEDRAYQPPAPGVVPLAGVADDDGCVAPPPSGFFSGQPVSANRDAATSDQPTMSFMRGESHGGLGLHKVTRHTNCSRRAHDERQRYPLASRLRRSE